LPDFIDFHQRSDGKPLTLGTDSVILTEKAATLLGLQVGDKITVRDNDQKEVSLPIGGIMENYLFAYVYIPPALFESSFGRACDFNTLYVRTDPTGLATDSQRKAFATELIQTGSVTGAVFNQDTTHTFDVLLSSIDAIVLMVALFAGALALVVLYNLTNINITERQKELATLKVLGFQRGELSSYIFREVTILTLLGSIGGLLLGKLLLVFIIQVIEMPGIMFGRTIAPPSYLIAFGVTMAFSLLVNLLMAGKLRRINMAESLKAPE
jgi:putative ABC transport system permease protein